MLAGLSVLSTGGAGAMAVVWGVWSSQGRLSKAGMGKVDVFFSPKLLMDCGTAPVMTRAPVRD